ncbi:hypothetical protein STIAU_4676 [Stigmatella aurantiaca DW4/3-1]|uniref:Uncharacterized protein n=1 Tax=Stigmatella aurantiaca (strain DW4/3-1) TaxID=378806 RepID=Q08X55_STIAD|nr:hypothetical protein STIAU_4676 [Stigmatella aurantiaca DW4/3-1]
MDERLRAVRQRQPPERGEDGGGPAVREVLAQAPGPEVIHAVDRVDGLLGERGPLLAQGEGLGGGEPRQRAEHQLQRLAHELLAQAAGERRVLAGDAAQHREPVMRDERLAQRIHALSFEAREAARHLRVQLLLDAQLAHGPGHLVLHARQAQEHLRQVPVMQRALPQGPRLLGVIALEPCHHFPRGERVELRAQRHGAGGLEATEAGGDIHRHHLGEQLPQRPRGFILQAREAAHRQAREALHGREPALVGRQARHAAQQPHRQGGLAHLQRIQPLEEALLHVLHRHRLRGHLGRGADALDLGLAPLQPREHRVDDALLQRPQGLVVVLDDEPARRILARHLQEGLPHAHGQPRARQPLAAVSVRVPAFLDLAQPLAQPRQVRLHVHQDDQVRPDALRGQLARGRQIFQGQAPPAAAQGQLRVEVAVADAHLAPAERGGDDFLELLSVPRQVEEELGARAHLQQLRVPGEVPDASRDGRLQLAALAGVSHLVALTPQPRGQEVGECRLAAAVDAFEVDKHGALTPKNPIRGEGVNPRHPLGELAVRRFPAARVHRRQPLWQLLTQVLHLHHHTAVQGERWPEPLLGQGRLRQRQPGRDGVVANGSVHRHPPGVRGLVHVPLVRHPQHGNQSAPGNQRQQARAPAQDALQPRARYPHPALLRHPIALTFGLEHHALDTVGPQVRRVLLGADLQAILRGEHGPLGQRVPRLVEVDGHDARGRREVAIQLQAQPRADRRGGLSVQHQLEFAAQLGDFTFGEREHDRIPVPRIGWPAAGTVRCQALRRLDEGRARPVAVP